MSGRIDHATESRGLLYYATEAVPPGPSEMRSTYIAEAQVHATLALVEQQRVANLIALAQVTIVPGDMPVMRGIIWEGERLRSDIREALGL